MILLLYSGSVSSSQNFTLTGHSGGVFGVAFSSDHSYLSSCDNSNTIKFWNALTNWTLMFQVSNGACLALIQLPNGQLAAGSGFNINIWDPLNTVVAPLTTLTGHTDKVLVLVLSPNGSLLASGSADTSVKLWSFESQTTFVKTLTGHTDKVRTLCFVSNQILASGSYDLTIKVWDISSGNLKA